MNARVELRRGGERKQKQEQYLGTRPQRRKRRRRSFLRRGLVLRGHTVAHGHARVLATCLLLLLEVLIVGHLLLLLVGHVAWVQAWTRHVALGRVVSHVLGGLRRDVGSVDAILAGRRVGSVQTSLGEQS